jgi:hypothetical protein
MKLHKCRISDLFNGVSSYDDYTAACGGRMKWKCGTLMEKYWDEKPELLGQKLVEVPLSPHILQGLAWDRNQALAKRSRKHDTVVGNLGYRKNFISSLDFS